MTNRIPWTRTEDPKRFAAQLPNGGTAELWWHPTNHEGPAGWRWRVTIGETHESGHGNDRQHASDEANRALPSVARHEQVRVAAIAARDALHRQIDAAYEAGSVDVMSFGLGSSDYDRLRQIMDYLRRRGWIGEALKPLREAVSVELYRRRVGR